MLKILLVEDNESLGFLVQDSLERHGFTVHLCTDGLSGWQEFNQHNFDLCILDVMLPVLDGFTLAQQIKQVKAEVPLMFLTAKGRPEDRIQGLTIGADDYLTKPFSIEELNLRIKVILKRSGNSVPVTLATSQKISFSCCILDIPNQQLTVKDQKQKLTHKETEVLRILCLEVNNLVKRDTILRAVWEDNGYFVARSMDVFISRLRKYLKADQGVKISTIHGIGYKLEVRASG